MTVSCTSKAAYRETDRAKCRAQVFKRIASRPVKGWTRQELAEELSMEVSSICGRVNELMKSGAVVNAGRCRKSKFGKSCNVVRVAN